MNSAIDGSRVVTFPLWSLMARALRRSPLGEKAVDWEFARTDLSIARWLRGLGDPPALVHGFEGGCLATLAEARTRGCSTVLDVPIAREYAIRAINEETGSSASGSTSASYRSKAEREQADWLLAPSDFVVRCLLEHGVSPGRILLLPYGVDADLFRPGPTQRGDGATRVLFVGRLAVRKGVRHLLDAWRSLRLRGAELVLVGGADPQTRSFLRASGDNVRWVDQANADLVKSWFQRSDIFAFPSLAEGSALVTYEAMACGLPVVTTPNSGSVVRHGLDGLIVQPRDITGLADSIHALLADADLRREMGASGRRRIEELYTWRHYRWRLAVIYADILTHSLAITGGRSTTRELSPTTADAEHNVREASY
jgi:glycosyltransferase involved in cell wall biosynthesis